MLVGLNISKFNSSIKDSDAYFTLLNGDSSLNKNWADLKFPKEIDTQDFVFANDSMIIAHHTAFKAKTKKYSNIEFYTLQTKGIKLKSESVYTLPNDSDLKFPTCLAYKDSILAVGIGGEQFESKIYLYEITEIGEVKTVAEIDVANEHKSPPSGMALSNGRLFVSFYIANEVRVYNLSKRLNLETIYKFEKRDNPLSVLEYNGGILVSCHTSNKIISLNNKSKKILTIDTDLLDSPWGMEVIDNNLKIANLGLQKGQEPFVISLDLKRNQIVSKRLNLGINQLRSRF